MTAPGPLYRVEISEILVAVVVRPHLWFSAVATVVGMVPRKWWARPPFIPVPSRDVLRWRVTTAYGHPDMVLVPDDVLSYLRWRRQM